MGELDLFVYHADSGLWPLATRLPLPYSQIFVSLFAHKLSPSSLLEEKDGYSETSMSTAALLAVSGGV